MDKQTLNTVIQSAGVSVSPAYTTGEISKILGVSVNTVISLCDNWTPDSTRGLECYRIGTHRRIPNHTLLQWLTNNSEYNRLKHD